MARARKQSRKRPGPRGLRPSSFERLVSGRGLSLYGSLPDPDPQSEILPCDIVGEWSERVAEDPEDLLATPTVSVEALLGLIENTRTVAAIRSYYFDSETLDTIGDRLRVSKEWVRQIIQQGLREIYLALSAEPAVIAAANVRATLRAARARCGASVEHGRCDRPGLPDYLGRCPHHRAVPSEAALEARRIAYEIEYAARAAPADRAGFERGRAALLQAEAAQKDLKRLRAVGVGGTVRPRTVKDRAVSSATRTEYRRLANELGMARADERTARSTGKGIEAAIECTHRAEAAYAEARTVVLRLEQERRSRNVKSPGVRGAPAKSPSSVLAMLGEKVP
jgi:hypothetical protein